jgi:ssDNA thymidine ADP-ribosyltransferase, DarT
MFESWLTLEKAYLFRITHSDNLPFILREGMACRHCLPQDPNFVNIGAGDIIEKRDNKRVDIAPQGRLSDYVPFYFAPRSPMLYSIRHQQDDIVYIVTRASMIEAANLSFVFTDGHALQAFSQFFNDLKDLDAIDWPLMQSEFWRNTEEDNDRRRRRMAEFLVWNSVPPECIGMICTKTEAKAEAVKQMVAHAKMTIPVACRENWYY